MDEFWSFAGVIALWLGVSCGLWWLHRRSVHSKQRRQMRQAVRAAAYVADAQNIFDAIRRPVAAGAALTAETHALLKRVQDHSVYFDKVNVLRVDMLAAFGIEDYPPLAEILHIRRDLWAASEILLIEDLSSFGESFAEPGAYERFRAEAAALLFKSDGAKGGDEDVIDLRLSLARGEADRLPPELKDAIRLARERDRLPTAGEIIAYPVGVITAVPGKLRMAGTFLAEFYIYAAEIAGAIRRSEAMERGVSELRRAREQLPQRLVTGFERASDTARQSATGLRRHYDFLVAAHDFQAKYEQTLRRAPQVTERGRQFIARLELAERSERLRLTSANLLIWLTRQLATGLAYLLAGLQQLHALLSETPPGLLAAALVAPTPIRGRDLPAFRSYRMALGASGFSEARPVMARGAGSVAVSARNQAGKASMAGTAKQSAKRGATAAAKMAKSVAAVKAKPAVSPPATAETRQEQAELQRSAVAAPGPRPVPAMNKAAAKGGGQPAQDDRAAKANRPGVAAPVPAAPVAVTTAAKTSEAAEPPVSKQAGDKRRKPDQAAVKPAASTPVDRKAGGEAPLPQATSVTGPAQPLATAAKRDGADPISARPERIAPQGVPPSLSGAPESGRRGLFSRTSSRGAEIETSPPAIAKAKSERLTPEHAPSGRSDATPESGRRRLFSQTSSRLAEIGTPQTFAADPPGPPPAGVPSGKPRSFLDRLLGRRAPEATLGDLLAAAWEREHAAEARNDVAVPMPSETAPTLLGKLSELPADEPREAIEDADADKAWDDPAMDDDVGDDTDDDIGDDPQSLTFSVMEVQAKLAPKPAQIRSFPWLRG